MRFRRQMHHVGDVMPFDDLHVAVLSRKSTFSKTYFGFSRNLLQIRQMARVSQAIQIDQFVYPRIAMTWWMRLEPMKPAPPVTRRFIFLTTKFLTKELS